MSNNELTCPFCGTVQEMYPSEFTYTSTGCVCGARFNFDNVDSCVSTVLRLPSNPDMDVSEETIRRVLADGIRGDGVSISRYISTAEIEKYDVEVNTYD